MSRRTKGAPILPTSIREIRRALKEETTRVMLTPAERYHVPESFPLEASSRRELLLYARLREAFKFGKEELERFPREGVDIGTLDHMQRDILLSVEQLELLDTNLETLEKAGKLPNNRYILEAWEKFENALDDEPEPAKAIATADNGQLETIPV